MRLIKLTPTSNTTGFIPHVYISADTIVEIEISGNKESPTTIVAVSTGKWYEVLETPETIERLANSDVNREPNFRDLVDFAQWYSSHQKQYIGRSYANMVDAYISEKRRQI